MPEYSQCRNFVWNFHTAETSLDHLKHGNSVDIHYISKIPTAWNFDQSLVYHMAWLFWQLVLAKGANSAASCTCSINNGTGGVSTGQSSILFSLAGASSNTDDGWEWESRAFVMHLVTSCQLQHIVHMARQVETLRRLKQHVQTISKTYFYNKKFSKPLGGPCVQYIDPKITLSKQAIP